MTRRQLPPQIRKVEITDRRTGKPVIRYQVTADAGINPDTGRRQQTRRRYSTEKEARDALAGLQTSVANGSFVARSSVTVEQVCAAYINGRHNLRKSSLSKLSYDLAPLRERHGDLQVQRLTKAHLDALVRDLCVGGTRTSAGRKRKPWAAVSVNKVIDTIGQVLDDAQRQGIVNRNPAAMLARVSVPYSEVDTYTEAEVNRLLAVTAEGRLAHVLELALCGLRRGEIAGLRWSDIDLEAATLSIVNNRVHAGNEVVEGDPKSVRSRRVLPLPERLVTVLRAARVRQAEERLALGGGAWEYVACNQAGDPYHPQVLSRVWAKAVKSAGLRHIKLHGGRHTAATHMHLMGVPMAVIAAWVGHTDPTLTQRLYAHSQDGALKSAAQIFDRVVTMP